MWTAYCAIKVRSFTCISGCVDRLARWKTAYIKLQWSQWTAMCNQTLMISHVSRVRALQLTNSNITICKATSPTSVLQWQRWNVVVLQLNCLPITVYSSRTCNAVWQQLWSGVVQDATNVYDWAVLKTQVSHRESGHPQQIVFLSCLVIIVSNLPSPAAQELMVKAWRSGFRKKMGPSRLCPVGYGRA